MEALRTLDGVVAALPLANVDTDRILPAQFMKTTTRLGLGKFLFHALRTDASGQERPDFVLNRAPWNSARFLVALDNFGCGSSREHAPWALADFGIRCVIAPTFADIFSNNCIKNGILPLQLSHELCDLIIADSHSGETSRLRLDVPRQKLTRSNGQVIDFCLEAERKRRLIDGLDDITETLRFEQAIAWHDDHVFYPRPAVPQDVGNATISHSRSRRHIR